MLAAIGSGATIGILAGTSLLPTYLNLVALIFLAVVTLTCGICATWFAFARFELFLLGLFAVRPMLDAFKSGGEPSSSLSPSVAAGVLFLLAALWRLYQHWRRGRWVRLSWMTFAFMTVPLAGLLTFPTSVSVSTSIIETLRLLTGALMFVVLEQELGLGTFTHKELMRWVMASLLLVIPYCIVQEITGFGIEFDPDIMGTRVQGPFVHPSVLAKYLVILLLWMVAAWSASVRRTRVILAIGILTTAFVLELTQTRAAWGAALLGVLVILGRRNWRFVPVVLAATVAVAAIPSVGERITSLFTNSAPVPGVPANSLVWRFEYWQELIPLARMTPFNGLGAGTVTIISRDGLEPHNTWVGTFVESGVFGLAALLFTIGCFFVTLRRAAHAGRTARVTNRARVVADSALACGIVLFLFIQTENLLTETSTLWYSAAVMCGASVARNRPTTGSSATEFSYNHVSASPSSSSHRK